jgi:hypothetical protein
MAAPYYSKKRRTGSSRSKNELKAMRGESARQNLAAAGTLRSRFPHIAGVRIEVRMESEAGALLQDSTYTLGPDQPFQLDVPCLGGCANGVYLLTAAVEAALGASQDYREGQGLCQSGSYADPNRPCGTKIFYRLNVE